MSRGGDATCTPAFIVEDKYSPHPPVTVTSTTQDDYVIDLNTLNMDALRYLAPATNNCPSPNGSSSGSSCSSTQIDLSYTFIENLQTVADNYSGVIVSLGFLKAAHSGPGFIVVDNTADGTFGMNAGDVLQSVFLSTAACSSICQPNDTTYSADGELSFPLLNWSADPPNADSVSGASGICAIVTLAHILTWSQVVPVDWDGVVSGANWSSDFMNRIWIQAGRHASGTPNASLGTAFGAAWNTVTYGEFAGFTQPSAPGFPAWLFAGTTIQQWCQGISADPNNSCMLRLIRSGGAHLEPIDSATWDNAASKCVLVTENAGRQGRPPGTDVPRAPGTHTWEVSGTAAATTIAITAGDHDRFWAGRGYTSVVSHK